MLLDAEARRHAYLVVRVAAEHFALPLDAVTEALDAPTLLTVAGITGHRSGFVDWRGSRVPLCGPRAPFGLDADSACAFALVLVDATGPLALAVDELCDVRELPPSTQRDFTGRHDPHGVVHSVVVDGDTLIAVADPAAVRLAMLAAAAAPVGDSGLPSAATEARSA